MSSAGIDNNAAGSTKIRGTPYNFPYAGLVDNGSFNYAGSYGYYWSSTASIGNDSSSSFAYDLRFSSGEADAGYDNRWRGFSVRCIAQ